MNEKFLRLVFPDLYAILTRSFDRGAKRMTFNRKSNDSFYYSSLVEKATPQNETYFSQERFYVTQFYFRACFSFELDRQKATAVFRVDHERFREGSDPRGWRTRVDHRVATDTAPLWDPNLPIRWMRCESIAENWMNASINKVESTR